MNDITIVDSSVCTSGIAVETVAMRSPISVTSPPTINPSSGSFSGMSTSVKSVSDFSNTRSAPFTTVQPAAGSASSFTSMIAGSW